MSESFEELEIENEKRETWNEKVRGQPRKVLYEILWSHKFDDKSIPDSELRDAVLSAARGWEFQGWSHPLAEEWERNGDQIARETLKKYDPEWVESQKKNRE